jgi:hypothetical protein
MSSFRRDRHSHSRRTREVSPRSIFRDQTCQTNTEATVRQALKRGVKACHVVTLDWLEDSIHKNKKLSETPYLLITLLKAERASELEQQKKARAAELEKRFVNTSKSTSPSSHPPRRFTLLTSDIQTYTTSTTTQPTSNTKSPSPARTPSMAAKDSAMFCTSSSPTPSLISTGSRPSCTRRRATVSPTSIARASGRRGSGPSM